MTLAVSEPVNLMAMVPGTKIFLVDDDPAVRDSLKLILECHGFVVRDFASGTAFLSSEECTLGGCLLVDVHMPVIGGIEMLERLATMRVVPATVMITGRADPDTRRRAFAAGASALLEKPFDASALLAALEQAVGSQSAG